MDFVLGVLGIIQITLLPGLIVYKFFRLKTDLFEKVLIIFGTSLIANYCVIFLLAALHIYTRIIFSIFILAELIAIVWLYRNEFNTSTVTLLEAAQDGINKIIGFFFPKKEECVSVWRYFLGILLLLLSAKSIAWAVSLFVQNLGTVFSTWDAVVSWNRWATDWAASRIPMDSHFYPQLIPANWSITYVLLGSTTIQFFAKAIMPLFTLMILFGFLNLSIQTKKYHFLISLILSETLLKKFLNTGLYNGYVDIAVAFFAFGTIYILLKAQETSEIEQRNRLYILGAIFSAGAAVTKQSGVYIALCYPVLILVQMFLLKVPLDRKYFVRAISTLAVISIIWASWYVLKEVQILTGADRANIDTLVSLSANTYNHANLFEQIVIAIGQYKELIVLFVLIAVTFLWMDGFYKALTLLFAPYPIAWAWMASYDTRNLAIFLPVLALLSGYSIYWLIVKGIELVESRKNLRMPVSIPLALALLALFSLNYVASPQKLYQRQVNLQKQIFSPAKNQMLYDLVKENGPQTRVLTNYPMNYIPGLEQYQVRFDFDDYGLFLSKIQNPEIGYLLVPNGMDQKVREYIDAKINSGDYQVLVKDKQWKVFTLIKILNR